MIPRPQRYRVLIVDDEPDVHQLTRLSLKGLRYRDRGVDFDVAASGKEAVESVRARPDTAVILLDVVMETTHAGLDAVKAIRGELNNRFVRILLRTGQPGAAPERKVIDEYDIDGYLAKAEITTNRLYGAVRTAIKAFDELLELERHREVLSFLNRSMAGLRSYEPLETTLRRVLETAVALTPAPLAVLGLQTMDEKGNPKRVLEHLATGDPARAAAAAREIQAKFAADPAAHTLQDAAAWNGGTLCPLALHRNLGHGWIWLEGSIPDDLARQALPLLAAHAANALYAAVAQAVLEAREGPFFESVTV